MYYERIFSDSELSSVFVVVSMLFPIALNNLFHFGSVPLTESFHWCEIQGQYNPMNRSQVGSRLVKTRGLCNMDGNSNDEMDWDQEIDNYCASLKQPHGSMEDGNSNDEIDWDQEIDNYCASLKQPHGSMEGNASGEHNNDIDWADDDDDDDDEQEIEDFHGKAIASSSAGPSRFKLIDYFLGMGFPEEKVKRAIKETGVRNTDLVTAELQDLITDKLLSLLAPDSSDSDENMAPDSSDSDENMEDANPSLDIGKILSEMGYTVQEASMAMDKCGPNAPIDELTDFITAAQMATSPQEFSEEIKVRRGQASRVIEYDDDDDEPLRIPLPMVGFGVPGGPGRIRNTRYLPKAARGPPYFYFENVARTPKRVWQIIQRILYHVEPEFVDSMHFCAAARKRGYVHNLPIHNRVRPPPLPPKTIKEALPRTKKWWPKWDTRTQLNCVSTAVGYATPKETVRQMLRNYNGVDPPPDVQRDVLQKCKKLNLVWVGKNNNVDFLKPQEKETLLGFPVGHTSRGGASNTQRHKSLGNSFQVDTVAYHLSVLKDLYPRGINVLSLFSGIGGAEVALHRLGIPLMNVLSVEKSKANQRILSSWWQKTNQKGKLVEYDDVQDVDERQLEEFVGEFGGFDLVIGGSPCNNLSGNNRKSRTGLMGPESGLFYEFFRILELVRHRKKP